MNYNPNFKLVDFLWLYNGRSNVFAFAALNMIMYVAIVATTFARAVLDKGNGWSIAVCVLNLCTFALVTMDARFWSFTNPIMLFFVITAESLCLAANILVRSRFVLSSSPFSSFHCCFLSRSAFWEIQNYKPCPQWSCSWFSFKRAHLSHIWDLQ